LRLLLISLAWDLIDRSASLQGVFRDTP